MASDWIKMRTDLYRDPKVCVMADLLIGVDSELARYVNQNCQCDMTVTRNVTRNAVVGALVSVWGVMRHRGKRVGSDLVCRGTTLRVIDDVSDLPGFGQIMASVGWAVEQGDNIVFPAFFDEYNVDPSEKKTSSSAARQRRYRERQQSDEGGTGDAVSDVTRDVTRDVTVTHREEKSREEDNNNGAGARDVTRQITEAFADQGVDDAFPAGAAVVADVLRKSNSVAKYALTPSHRTNLARLCEADGEPAFREAMTAALGAIPRREGAGFVGYVSRVLGERAGGQRAARDKSPPRAAAPKGATVPRLDT